MATLLVTWHAAGQEPTPTSPEQPAENEALRSLRERFRAGKEKYDQRAFAEAIVIWSAIYKELGPEQGYRLALNLARAYDQFGDTPQAAELYQSYLDETDRRRNAGETIEPEVEKQEAEAKERLTALAETMGRIELHADGAVPVGVKIDDGAPRRSGIVVYVRPDKVHRITWRPGTEDEVQVKVRAPLGEVLVLTAPPRKEHPARVPPPPVRYETQREHPYSPVVMYVAGGITVLSAVLPILVYANAPSINDRLISLNEVTTASNIKHDTATGTSSQAAATRARDDYESARSTAYALVAVPAVLAATTAVLTAYWFWGVKEQRVPLQGGLVPRGAVIGATRSF
jgi:hypothetical protein